MTRSLPSPRLSPYLVVGDAAGLLSFMERALGARTVLRRAGADGRVVHAEARVGGVLVMVGTSPDGRAFPAMLHLFVSDVDAAHARAVEAGAASVREPAGTGRGSRMSGVRDPFGNEWWFTMPVTMRRLGR
jgi:PhnB protein